jgi:polysaccharide biosynthesis transport protein
MNDTESKQLTPEVYHQESYDYIDISKYWYVLRRRWRPAAAAFLLTIIGAGIITAIQKPTYQAQGKLLLNKEEADANQAKAVGKELGELDSLANQVIVKLNLKNQSGERLKIKEFKEHLEVQTLKDTFFVAIAYQSKDPDEASAVVEELMNSYVNQNLKINRAKSVATREFIEKQLPATQEKFKQAELELRQFKQQNNILNLEEEEKKTATKLAELSDQIDDTKISLADANKSSEAFQGSSKLKLNADLALALNALNESSGVQKVLTQLQSVENQLAIESSRFSDATPAIKNLKEEQTHLRSLLQQRIRQVANNQSLLLDLDEDLLIGLLQQKVNPRYIQAEMEKLVLNNKMGEISKLYSATKQKSTIIPQLQERQRYLETKVEAARESYSNLLRKLEEIKIAENENIGQVQIIDESRLLDKPVAPKKFLNLAAGVGAGMFLGILVALISHFKDNSLQTVDETKKLLKYKILAIIPDFNLLFEKGYDDTINTSFTLPKIPFKSIPGSLLNEIFGMLYTNIKFSTKDNPKILTITSCVPAEGKSTISANFALTLSQLGLKVLLIDTDLRSPSQHKFWGQDSQLGLSDILANSVQSGNVQSKRILQEVTDNIHLITAGLQTSNPLALINSPQMSTIVRNLAVNYDFVLLDTPPLNIGADTHIISTISDGIVLVVNPQVVDIANAVQARENLEECRQNVLGIIVNGVNTRNEPNHYLYGYGDYGKKNNPAILVEAKE